MAKAGCPADRSATPPPPCPPQRTHAPTHTGFSLTLRDAFALRREGEAERYEPYKELPGRTLLWHGSRLTNFVGILRNGLRVAPKEAPVTGVTA